MSNTIDLKTYLALSQEHFGQNYATSDDTVKICEAINIANPGGLGDVLDYDTKSMPAVKLREIMSYSAQYDRISYQYHNKK